MSNTLYQDAHLHIINNFSIDVSPEIGRLFLNSTSAEDFSSVKAITTPSTVPFFGVHPWFVTDKPIPIETIDTEIKQTDNAGIGECGLDFSSRYKYYKQLQIKALESQLIIARKHSRPISIHCVKASNQLIKILYSFAPLNAPFIIHSFYGSKETLSSLLTLGAYVSISSLSLKNPEKSYQVINTIPVDRLLIESDIFIGEPGYTIDKHLKILENNYRTISQIKGISVDNLKEMVWDNGTIFTN